MRTSSFALLLIALLTGCVGSRRPAPQSIRVDVDQEFVSTRVLQTSPFVLDLGVGEAPYDDGFRTREVEFEPARGFSDALILLKMESQIADGTHLVGAASTMRVQDEPLSTVLDDPSISWFTLGVRFSW